MQTKTWTGTALAALASLVFQDAEGAPMKPTIESHRTETGIAYAVAGDGETTVVFVHGANADRTHWHRQMGRVPDGRRHVALDLAGHGESSDPSEPFSMEVFARGVAEVLDDLALERAILVGHSNGVAVVRQFARSWPERVLGLLFADGALVPPISPEMEAWMRGMLARPDYEAALKGMVEMTPRGGLADEDYALVKAVHLATSKSTALGWLDAMTDPAAWTEDRIGAPVLVLRTGAPGGSGGSSEGGDPGEEVLRRIAPHAVVESWNDCGHFLMLERPDELERALLALSSRAIADARAR